MDVLLTHELLIRLGFFLGVFALVAVGETLVPRRAQTFSRMVRWPGNLGIVALNTVALRVVFSISAVGFAQSVEGGLLNHVAGPAWVELVVAVVIMDFAIWLQHVMVHAIPVLWRLHRMHHADLEYDVTTGARFHPLEILLSMGLKLMVIALLGPSAAAVIVFEVLLNATAMFNHGNLRLPRGLDGALRWILVTPDMHRVHHSIHPQESNCNFGFNLPWWDWLLGTYRQEPAEGHEAMTLGIDSFRAKEDLRLDRLLVQPFRETAGDYSINRRPFEENIPVQPQTAPEPSCACDGSSSRKKALLLLLGLAVVGGGVFAFRDGLDLGHVHERVHDMVAAAGPWGAVAFVLLFAVGTVLFVPGSVYSLAGGALFGPVIGVVLNLSGATLGAVLAFLAARHGAQEWVRARTGARLTPLIAGVEAEGWRFVAFVRLVPLFPFTVMNYAFGVTRIGLVPYVLATVVCMIPGSLAYTWMGFAGREALAGGEGMIRNGSIALALLATAVFLPRLVKQMRGTAQAFFTRVDVSALRQPAHDPALRLVDVRNAIDFNGGHIDGAINIPLPDLTKQMHVLKDWRNQPLAVICRTDRRSRAALDILKTQGFTNLILVNGGMLEWTRQGLPVVQE